MTPPATTRVSHTKLSRTLDLIVLEDGSGILLRNDRPAFRLSSRELDVFAAAAGARYATPVVRIEAHPRKTKP